MRSSERKGRARLYVPHECAPKGAKEPVFGVIAFDAMELKDQFDLWAHHLALSEQYVITGVYYDLYSVRWLIIVESVDIPFPPTGEPIPELIPEFQRLEDGTIEASKLSLLPYKLEARKE